MKIVFFCKRYYTNKDLISDRFGRLFYIPKYLAEFGAEVLVVCLSYRDNQFSEQNIDGVKFISIGIKGFNALGFWWQAAALIREFSPDILIASGDSHLGFMGLKFANKFNARFVFDVYDFYEGFGTNKLPFFKRMFRYSVTKADLVICASDPLKQYVESYNTNTLLVTNGIDPEIFRPLDQHACRQQLNLSLTAPIIGYFGSMEVERGIGELIAACQRLRMELPALKLLLAGRNSANWDLSADWIDYRGMRPQTEIPLMINACDLMVIPYHRGPVMDMGSSCKIAEYLSCQKKVLASRTPNFFAAFPELGLQVIWLDSLEPEQLAAGLLTALRTEQVNMALELDLSWRKMAYMLFNNLKFK